MPSSASAPIESHETLAFQRPGQVLTSATTGPGRLSLEYRPPVAAIDRPALFAAGDWQARGQKICLVTIVHVEGSGARPVGAQMAVNCSGETAGYLTGGCLEREFSLVALDCIQTGAMRLERYGRGSRFIDLRLPCGSGIDVLFDPLISPLVIESALAAMLARQPFEITTDVQSGKSQFNNGVAGLLTQGSIENSRFSRLFLPSIRVNIFGEGFATIQLALMLSAIGLEWRLHSDDDFTCASGASHGLTVVPVASFRPEHEDPWTAAALLFHAHERELSILEKVLRGPSFYVGAVGGKIAAATRARNLAEATLTPLELARLTAPAGMVRGAKSATELAAGIVAEVLNSARHQRLVI